MYFPITIVIYTALVQLIILTIKTTAVFLLTTNERIDIVFHDLNNLIYFYQQRVVLHIVQQSSRISIKQQYCLHTMVSYFEVLFQNMKRCVLIFETKELNFFVLTQNNGIFRKVRKRNIGFKLYPKTQIFIFVKSIINEHVKIYYSR